MTTTSTRNLDTGRSTPTNFNPWQETTPLLHNDNDTEATPPSAKPSSDEWNWEKLKERTAYYVPGTHWIPHYTLSQLRGDFLAGITVACLLIPQSISYATSLAKLSPLAGLFSASIPGLVYAIFGSSRQLNVAPEAALSLLIGQAVESMIKEDPHQAPQNPEAMAMAITTITTFQAGLFTFMLGILRLGFLDVVLSRALLRGFVTAIAFVIMIEQLIPMFGLVALEQSITPPLESTLEKLGFLLEHLPDVHAPTATVAFTSLAILVTIRYFKIFLRKNMPWIQSLPEILLVVVISTVLSEVFDWQSDGVVVLGKVNVGATAKFLEFPLVPSNMKFFKATAQTAVLISLVGYLDSMVSAKQNSARFGYSISSNRELVALGAANIGGSFVPGTLPAYGSITRSRLNADLGGTSQMASVICSVIILLATFFLLPALAYLPKCVLSAIVFLVVISLLTELPHEAGYYWRMRSYPDLLLMTLTFVLTIIWNIEVGVLVSFVISLLLIVHRSSKVRISILGRVPGTDHWTPVSEDPSAEELSSGILIIRIRENLDFANTAQVKERLRRLELFGHAKHHPSERPRRQEARMLGFHMSDVQSIDASAVQIFYELLESYKTRQVTVFLSQLQPAVYESFKLANIFELVGDNRVYDSLAHAISDFEMTQVPVPVEP